MVRYWRFRAGYALALCLASDGCAAGMLSLISFQVGKIGAGSSNELINGFCSALPTSLWLVVVFFKDRWPTSELYLLMAAVMPFSGMLGGLVRRKQNWERFELPTTAKRQEK